MTKRLVVVTTLLGIVLLCAALALGVVGCGSGSTTTTAAPVTSTTLASTTTTAAALTTTTSAGSPTSTAAGPPTAQYGTQFLAFAQALENLPTTGDPSSFTDVSKVSAAQLAAAKKFVADVHSAVDQLKAMQPPAAIAAAHQKVLADIEAIAAAMDTLMTAIENKDQAAFDAALKQGQPASQAFQTDMGSLGALAGGTTVSS